MNDITIRNLQYNEMGVLINMLANQGWNPSNNDPDLFYRIDNNGFIVAVTQKNETAGLISAVNYGKSFGFIGMHMISSGFEEYNIGGKLLNVALQKLGSVNIGLNSFEYNVEFYEKFGFQKSHKILTYEGITNGNYTINSNIASPFMLPVEHLLEFDKKIFPYDRKNFLELWLNQPGSLLLAKYEDDNYKGYGLFRPCLNGYKISPLIADNYAIGEEILSALLSHLQIGTIFYIDVPDTNEDGIRLAEKMSMKKINETIRMYSGSEINILLKNVFSFNSFEIG